MPALDNKNVVAAVRADIPGCESAGQTDNQRANENACHVCIVA
jgi:hypothetical protein